MAEKLSFRGNHFWTRFAALPRPHAAFIAALAASSGGAVLMSIAKTDAAAAPAGAPIGGVLRRRTSAISPQFVSPLLIDYYQTS